MESIELIIKLIIIIAMIVIIGILILKTWKFAIFPMIVRKTTKELEKNPKWITPKLKETYYGFSDIDIITAESSIGALPRFRLNIKKKNEIRLEVLIPNDIPVDNIDEIAEIALQGKLYLYHHLYFPDKPAYWLSILLYMLDGGNIRQEGVSWEINYKQDKKPVDDL